jgi:hypothetical protein
MAPLLYRIQQGHIYTEHEFPNENLMYVAAAPTNPLELIDTLKKQSEQTPIYVITDGEQLVICAVQTASLLTRAHPFFQWVNDEALLIINEHFSMFIEYLKNSEGEAKGKADTKNTLLGESR